jgi:hypothetical protein
MKFFFIEQDNNPKESFVPGGRRVVDIGHLLSALKNINHKIYGCAFSNIDIVNEKHLGSKVFLNINVICAVLWELLVRKKKISISK